MEPLPINNILAIVINTTGVFLGIEVLKRLVPIIKMRFPVVLTILALVAGPLFMFASGALTNLLGYSVDLSPIAQWLSGALAIAVHNVVKQNSKTVGALLS